MQKHRSEKESFGKFALFKVMVEAYRSTHEPWIGIHIGTKNACAGVWRNGTVEIVQNDYGLTFTPCVVSYRPNQEIVVGLAVLDQQARFPEITIYDV